MPLTITQPPAAVVLELNDTLDDLGTNLSELDPSDWLPPEWPDTTDLFVYVERYDGDSFTPERLDLGTLLTSITGVVNKATGDTAHTWAVGERHILCFNTGALTITLPNTGLDSTEPVHVYRLGAGTVTLAAGASATINKPADKALTARLQFSVIKFVPYFVFAGTTLHVASGDLT